MKAAEQLYIQSEPEAVDTIIHYEISPVMIAFQPL